MASNPYVNKVVANGNTVMDISDTTSVAADVAAGTYFYTADGKKTSGSLSFSTIHTSSSAPTSSQGSNGDVWLVVS